MRTLKFVVKGQKLSKDPACDFTGIPKGSSGFLRAEFAFDSEWNGTVRAAEFAIRIDGKESLFPVLIKNGACEIPPEVTAKRRFTVRVVGKRGDARIPTNQVQIIQEG